MKKRISEVWMNKLYFLLPMIFLTACGGGMQDAPKDSLLYSNLKSPGPPIALGVRGNYTINKTANEILVTDIVGSTGVQSFKALTQLVFADMTVNLEIGDQSQTISATDLQSLIELYIAYFNRVPDADGLSYWIDQRKSGQSIDQIGTSFYNAAIEYASLTGYSATMTDADFIKIIYKNVLGRSSVDDEGMTYWSAGLANRTQTRGTLVRSILDSAHTFRGDPDYGYVADLLDNKIKVANFFSVQQGLNYNTPEDSISKTMAMVAAITPTSTAGAVANLGNVDWNFRQVLNPSFKNMPIPLQRTSYLNAKNIGEIPRVLPLAGNARAFADFEQNGTLSYFVHTLEYNPPNRQLGHVQMHRLNPDGTSKDITSSMIEGDTTACLHPRKALVADFNGDGKPDVFIACHGYDSPDRLPADGEFPYLLASQANGHYKLVKIRFGESTDWLPYIHAAAAVDIDGSGFASVVVADHNALGRCASTLFVLKNNHDGTFTRDTSNFPNLATCTSFAVWAVEILDIKGDGSLALWAAGQDNPKNEAWGGLQSSVYAMKGNLQFEITPMMIFPPDPSWNIPLDIVVKNKIAYFVRVSDYFSYEIQRVDMSSMTPTVAFSSNIEFGTLAATNPACIDVWGQWIDFIHISQNKIVTDDSCRSPNIPAN